MPVFDKNNKSIDDGDRKSDVIWKTKLVDENGNNSITCIELMEVNDDEDLTY